MLLVDILENGYRPSRFSDRANTELGHSLWRFLNAPDNHLRMETASELRRPAVEALATRLTKTFGEQVSEDRTKRMIGHMVRQIMEERGFVLDGQNVRVRIGHLFQRASRYKRQRFMGEGK